MKRLLSAIVAVVLLASSTPSVSAGVWGPEDAFDAIDWSDAIDVDGWQIVFGEPNVRSRIPIAVRNDTGDSATVPLFTVSSPSSDGGTVTDDRVAAYPPVIEDGLIAIGWVVWEESFTFADESGDFEAEIITEEPRDDVRELSVVEVSLTDKRGGIDGTIENETDDDLGDIQINMLCVEDSGILTAYDFDVLDIRRVNAGDEAAFETRLPDDCGDLFLLSVIGIVR